MRLYFENDLRRRKLLLLPEIVLREDLINTDDPLVWEISELTLSPLKIGFGFKEDVEKTFSMRVGHAYEMVRILASMGIHSESDTEKDKRIKDLQRHINFLEAVVYNKMGVTGEQIQELRKLRE